MIRIEEYLGELAFEELRKPWEALHAEAGASPFLSPIWLETWHRYFGGGRRPRILAAWRGRRLVGLLPLLEERTPLSLRLGFLGERTAGADYLDVLAAPEERGAVAEALVAHLCHARGFDVLDLFELPAKSPLLPALHRQTMSDEAYAMRLEPRHVCPQVDLSDSWEKVLARSRRAENFRRRRRQIEARGGEYRLVRDVAESPAALERFLELHARRWEREGGSDGIGTPAHVAFHREVVPKLARAGWLRFEELWVEGGCRSSIYGIEHGTTYYFYQSGYDPEWRGQSVGLVLLGLSMEGALGRGIRVYDFLHGVEGYKLEWATHCRQTLRLQAYAKSAGALLLLGAEAAQRQARSWARSLLPKSAIDQVRRELRARRARAGGEVWKLGTRPGAS